MPESEEQRRNCELIELLNELRVVITDFLFHRAWAAAFTAIVALTFLVLNGLPLRAAYVDRKR